jgi:elongation factor 1 alpha-like protein
MSLYLFGQGGQTREHAQLLKSLGVRELVVAVNKLELLDWNQQRSPCYSPVGDSLYSVADCRFEFIREQLTPFLVGRTVGFKPKNITFVPVRACFMHIE